MRFYKTCFPSKRLISCGAGASDRHLYRFSYLWRMPISESVCFKRPQSEYVEIVVVALFSSEHVDVLAFSSATTSPSLWMSTY
jgi:hypothetical protein